MTTLDLGNKQIFSYPLTGPVSPLGHLFLSHQPGVTSLSSGHDSAAQDTETQDLPNARLPTKKQQMTDTSAIDFKGNL